MRLSDELKDPWGVLVAAVVGGSAWAVGLPAAAALAVGASVLGVKAALGALGGRRRRPPGGRRLPLRRGSVEQDWVNRAQDAVITFRRMAMSVRQGPVADRCTRMGEQLEETIQAMERLGGQASAVANALRHLDEERLTDEKARLTEEASRTRNQEVKSERKKAIEAVDAQLEVFRRLHVALRTLQARLESGAIGLEALVAQLAEVLAMSETTASPADDVRRIEDLALEIEGLRTGLVETEETSKRALRAYESQAG